MSRVADGLQKARALKDVEPDLAPEPGEPIHGPGASVPWHFEREEPPVRFPSPVWTRTSQEAHSGEGTGPEAIVRGPVPNRAAASDGHSAPGLLVADMEDGSLAQVIAPGFQRSWEEAVAIVQAVASQVRGRIAVPAPAHVLLEEAGSVTFASRNESEENPVVSLAVLLGWLLEATDAPSALWQLVIDNGCTTPALDSVRAFSRALAAFEDSPRQPRVAAVCARLKRRFRLASG